MIKLDYITGKISLDNDKFINFSLNQMLNNNKNFFTLFFEQKYKIAYDFSKDMSVCKVKITRGDESIILTLNVREFYKTGDFYNNLDFNFSKLKTSSLNQIKSKRMRQTFNNNIFDILSKTIEENYK